MDLNLNWRVLDVDNKATYPTVENHVIHFFVQSKMGKKYHLLGYLYRYHLGSCWFGGVWYRPKS